MNDTELHHLLHAADRPAPASASPALLADRVRKRAQRSRQRRLAAVPVIAAALALGVWFARPTPQPIVHHSPPARQPATPAMASRSIEDEIQALEQRISRLEQAERLARLTGRRAAVQDPVARLDELQAAALLERANGSAAEDSFARRQVLAVVIQQYPDTLTAAVARREMQTLQ